MLHNTVQGWWDIVMQNCSAFWPVLKAVLENRLEQEEILQYPPPASAEC